ncbi:hypothetical protein EWM64_g6806 [Hericium alpestre]|uniref:Protein kinase domain-containing protein n=1 Tax=Hericium alpestre TaxID=135208 RepID=A0A4Y9ZQM9_9AGAM|nr:hypothetical protein EWM64_g6806 [Hericium alpestre]
MALILSLPSFYSDEKFETYTLRSIDTDAPAPSDISFRGLKCLQRGTRSRSHIDVYRGYLTLSADKEPLDVVCKIGFGKIAEILVSEEASLYNGKLRHLQGKYIPVCHGYFVGDTSEGPAGCLLLAYCGEPVKDMLTRVQPAFKTALVHALVAIHDAGVEHRDLCRRNILDCHGRPMIIDFEDSIEHACERQKPIEIGAPAPSFVSEIGCVELFQFFIDIDVWTPAYIEYIGDFQPIKLAFDAHALAKTAPSHWSPEEALQEAYRVIIQHVRKYYPEQYEDWKAGLSQLLMCLFGI